MMKNKFLFCLILFLVILFIPFSVHAEEKPSIVYQTHVSYVGWQNEVNESSTAGTTGKSLAIEAIIIKLSDESLGSISYSTYVQDEGWQDWINNGSVSGTTGQSKRLEAIKIKLTDILSEKYDVYYRVHVENVGWMGWTSNGNSAGTTGMDRRLEAIEIKLVNKGSYIPETTSKSYIEDFSVVYQSHVSYVGWQAATKNGLTSGTTGKSKQLEAIKVKLNNKSLTGGITYQSYVKNIGWQSEVSDGLTSGTTGQNKRIEAVKMKLTGEYSEKYDVYYRVHVQNIGWMGWTSNGNVAGTIGYNYRIEAIEVKLVLKNDEFNGSTSKSFLEKESEISYQSHVQDKGWLSYVEDGDISGTTGKNKRLEAFKIKVSNETENSMISYQSHLSNVGWQDWVIGDSISGTIGQSRKVEAIRIKLTGDLLRKYDIYYRTHVENIGWMDWASNGNIAGTVGAGLRVEAIQIVLVDKGGDAPGNTKEPYKEAKWVTESDGNRYYYDLNGNLVTGSKDIGGITYYFGPTGIYLGTNKLKIIDVSYHQGTIDWGKVASSGIYGVILRIGYWTTEDLKLNEYIQNVKKYNIPYGIYLFSYASTIDGATKEANFTNSTISKYNLSPTLGIYYDIEDWYTKTESSNSLSEDQYDLITKTYITAVNSYLSNKYKVKIYANLNYTNNRLGSYSKSQVDWIAQYNSSCSYTGKYSMWQFTSSATIPGINGYVDMSYLYR